MNGQQEIFDLILEINIKIDIIKDLTDCLTDEESYSTKANTIAIFLNQTITELQTLNEKLELTLFNPDRD